MCNTWRKEDIKSNEKVFLKNKLLKNAVFEASTCEGVPTFMNITDFKVRSYYRKVEIFLLDIFLAKLFNLLFQSNHSFYSYFF